MYRRGTIEESQTEDVDWVNNWKEYFHQFYMDDILVVPSWEECQRRRQGQDGDSYRSGYSIRNRYA